LSWSALPPGVVAWMHHKLGWPPLYPCLAAMPPEDAAALLHLLRRDSRPNGVAGEDEDP